jgi:hypothetical protein
MMKRIYEETRSPERTKGIEVYVFAPSPNELNDEDHDFPCIIRFRERVFGDMYPIYAPDKWIFSFHEKSQAIREAIKLIDDEAVKRWG